MNLFSEFIDSIFAFCSNKTFLRHKQHLLEMLVRQKVIISFIFQDSFFIRLYNIYVTSHDIVCDTAGRVNTELWDPIFYHGSEGQASCLNYFSMY